MNTHKLEPTWNILDALVKRTPIKARLSQQDLADLDGPWPADNDV